MKKENEVILDLLRYFLDKKQKKKIISDLKKDLDWQYIYNVSIRQGVAPIIYKSLKSLRFTKEVTSAFKEAYNIVYKRNSKLYKELNKILKAFEKENIDVVLLKGIYLAKYVHRDIGLRPMCDIDILVKEKDLPRIIKILNKKNYKNSLRDKKELHINFFNSKKKTHIEAHYNIAKLTEKFYINPKDFFEKIEDSNKNLLNPEFFLLFMLLHISKHIRQDGQILLKWLIDILFFFKEEKVDFIKFNKLVQKYNLEKQIYLVWKIYKKEIDDNFKTSKIIEPPYLDKKVIDDIVYKYSSFKGLDEKNKYFVEFVILKNNLKRTKMIFEYLFPPFKDLSKNFKIEKKNPFIYLLYLINPIRILITFLLIIFKIK